MADEELRERLVSAAEGFPVRGWQPDLHRRVIRRQQRIRVAAVAAGVVVVAGAVVAAPLVSRGIGMDRDPVPAATASASPSPTLVGSAWTLIQVDDGHSIIAIPAEIGARMDLADDGQILINNGANALNGRFTMVAGGFEVSQVGTTYSLYVGHDPARLAAISALATLAYGNPDGRAPSSPVHDTVVSLNGTTLVVQAGTLRLTFTFAGAARTFLPPPATHR